MRILVVEDDPVSLKLATTILEQEGFETLSATSGKNAVSILEQNETVDIVVSDISMPVMDGFHLLSYLKADPRFEHIPVILCTAMNDEASVRKALTLGAIDYIVKPIQAATLLSKVKKVVELVSGAILIVDDEVLLRNLLGNMIRREGLKVIAAASAEEALAIMDKEKIALVLSDISMPGMNGLQLLAVSKEKFPSIPVVLITGHTGQFSRDSVLSAGGDGYISKPFKNAEIMVTVRQFIGRRQNPAHVKTKQSS